MKTGTRSGFVRIAAIACLAVTAAGAPAAFAAPNDPSAKLCTMSYPVPEEPFTKPAATDVFAISSNGVIDFTVHTDAGSDNAYDQKFTVTWANIDTGKSGVADTSARVQGPDNTFTVTGVATKPGRIALHLGVFNHGEGQLYTNGECDVEYQAG
ncbi:hypothetical protein DFR70_1021017 [Nocardia tenerifensis]|uniref:Uncharacterized protein n=1 Tax=Nocardia tenerifensis TaxID=228006 RepID=A0A318K7L1_9NOCA|nr:hypothetical protein [Nocardia tenerifensis]PXX69328.1 hypothetical protein DFR70_1021017 [Nocardia tenerifensis]